MTGMYQIITSPWDVEQLRTYLEYVTRMPTYKERVDMLRATLPEMAGKSLEAAARGDAVIKVSLMWNTRILTETRPMGGE